MTRSTAVLVDVQITQLRDHSGLGRHFLAIAANSGLPPGVAVALCDRPVHTVPQGS
jgi:hypothetical protein